MPIFCKCTRQYFRMFKFQRQCKLCGNKPGVLNNILSRRRFASLGKLEENIELAEAYKPRETEKLPIDMNYFTPEVRTNDTPFSLILPPPNITGTLHLGHALTGSIQDALLKWHKLHGKSTMWVPGLDHAGIATQVVVEKKLWKEQGLTRHDLGRDKFECEVWKWKQEKSSTIIEQLKLLKLDLNWDREAFTLDRQCSKAVTEAFIQLFEQGLIYRANHLVNWSCALQSALSDIEVEHVSLDGPTDLPVPGYDKPVKFGVLVRFAYKIADSANDELVVATTRPETILGDTAVAVHPTDPRYSHLIGKQVHHPFRDDLIPVIGDEFVDPQFGSGVVKVTPAHDPIDFEVGKRHQLKSLSVISEKGFLTQGDFKNIKRFEGREIVLKHLVDNGLFRGSEGHKMTVPICSRSKDVLEFLIKPQWFLRCSEMAARAAEDVRQGTLVIEPKQFEKLWFQWLDNIKDWCLSRQLWWGHRIPAYFCSQHKLWVAAGNLNDAKIKASRSINCNMEDIELQQDDDVLDTWFSSALLPFSVFGWPQKTDDLPTFFPLSVMETGHDILFFWVARMVMLGTHLTGRLPFDHVLLHGLICDAHGRKMSKSLGNVISPEDIVSGATLDQLNAGLNRSFESGILSAEELKKALEGQRKMFPKGIPECGVDGLRFTLLSHNVKNHFINFDVDECHTNRLFGNKVWQATKFTLMWINKIKAAQSGADFSKIVPFEELNVMDKWILSRLTFMLEKIGEAMEKCDCHLATAALKDFLYYEFCDVYLEAIKTALKDLPEGTTSRGHVQTLLTCLDKGLIALSPFMAVLAQHLHKHLPKLWGACVTKSFPKVLNQRNESLEKDVKSVMELVIGIRRLKNLFKVTYKYQPQVFVVPSSQHVAQEFYQIIKDLSHLYSLHILTQSSVRPNGTVEDIVGCNKIYLTVPQELKKSLAIDLEKMEAKRRKLVKELERLNESVSKSGYVEKASAETQENNKRRMAVIAEKIARIDHMRHLTK